MSRQRGADQGFPCLASCAAPAELEPGLRFFMRRLFPPAQGATHHAATRASRNRSSRTRTRVQGRRGRLGVGHDSARGTRERAASSAAAVPAGPGGDPPRGDAGLAESKFAYKDASAGPSGPPGGRPRLRTRDARARLLAAACLDAAAIPAGAYGGPSAAGVVDTRGPVARARGHRRDRRAGARPAPYGFRRRSSPSDEGVGPRADRVTHPPRKSRMRDQNHRWRAFCGRGGPRGRPRRCAPRRILCSAARADVARASGCEPRERDTEQPREPTGRGSVKRTTPGR